MEAPRSYRMREHPLTPDDYDVPVGWWGWNWEPPVPMSVTELLAAKNFDERTAALCWMVLEAHGSILIAAEPPHSGKTTTLTALLDLVPRDVRRVFLRGWAETFDFVRQTDPGRTILLANELSDHLPVYLWGPKAVEAFRALRFGYSIASTLHADSADEALAQLRDECGLDPADLARVDLLIVMRMYRVGSDYYGAEGAEAGRSGAATRSLTTYGAIARRVESVDRVVGDGRGVRTVRLVERDPRRDAHEHYEAAELELLCLRRGGDLRSLASELDERAAYLGSLRDQGILSIPAVRAAVAERRGERVPLTLRGDPTA